MYTKIWNGIALRRQPIQIYAQASESIPKTPAVKTFIGNHNNSYDHELGIIQNYIFVGFAMSTPTFLLWMAVITFGGPALMVRLVTAAIPPDVAWIACAGTICTSIISSKITVPIRRDHAVVHDMPVHGQIVIFHISENHESWKNSKIYKINKKLKALISIKIYFFNQSSSVRTKQNINDSKHSLKCGIYSDNLIQWRTCRKSLRKRASIILQLFRKGKAF